MIFYYLTLRIKGRRKCRKTKKVITKVARRLSGGYRCPGKAAVELDTHQTWFSRQRLCQVLPSREKSMGGNRAGGGPN